MDAQSTYIAPRSREDLPPPAGAQPAASEPVSHSLPHQVAESMAIQTHYSLRPRVPQSRPDKGGPGAVPTIANAPSSPWPSRVWTSNGTDV